MDEKKYLTKLLEQLKGFFTLEADEREDAAQDLNDNWLVDSEDAEISEATKEISNSLELLHHYAEDPELHDEIIAQILLDVERQLRNLEKVEKEKKGEENKEEDSIEIEVDEDEDLEDEKNTKYV